MIEYPEMTNDELKDSLYQLIDSVEDNQMLRYLYILTNERLKTDKKVVQQETKKETEKQAFYRKYTVKFLYKIENEEYLKRIYNYASKNFVKNKL